ncbi:MAG: TIM barrel protein [Desulfobacteraceae bacterium]|jgi:sugar phosphate isomerase/epimerase|nr:TIM barrel protein [Desulfobacteraceae bacterium]
MRDIEKIAEYLALNTLVFHGRKFEEAFAMAAELGFKYVEPACIKNYYPGIIDDSFFSAENGRAFLNMAANVGLKVKSVGVHFNMGDHLKDADDMKKRLDFAREMGAEIVITNGAVRQNAKGFFDCIEKVTPVLEDYGLVLALENPGCGAADSIIATGGDGASLMGKLANPHVRLNYDASNVYSYSKGKVLPEDDYLYAAPHCVCLHLKQLKKDGNRWLFSALGDGVTDYGRIIKGIKARYGIPFMSLELPVNHMRDHTLSICKNTDFQVASDELIRDIVNDSVKYVAGLLG